MTHQPAPADVNANSLSDSDKRLLLQVARQTLDHYLSTGVKPHFDAATPALRQRRAVFVTLWRRDSGELRGCRGESVARRILVDAVAAMAIAAAVDDPRFHAVTHEELPDLRIEINALTPLQTIDAEDVTVGVHGLMITHGVRAGLLLPEVPVRLGWTRLEFLEGLCLKASLPRDAWQEPDATLYAFESEEWSEP